MSLLNKYVGDASDTHTDLPPVSDEGVIILEPDAILDHRWVKQGGKFLAESLVKWKHLLTEEATWEVTESLCHQFPNLNLEDKVPLQERVLISHHEDMREQQNRIPSIVKCSERQDQDKRESCRIDDTKLKHEIFTTSASNAKHQFFLVSIQYLFRSILQ